MSTIVTRAAKGSALTHNEVDANFVNLNTDKVEKSGTDTVVINVNSATNALRITQTGTGNAFVVEDSTSPDSSPFVVDASGSTIVGASALQSIGISDSKLQVIGSGATDPSIGIGRFRNDGGGALLAAFKGRGSLGTFTTVNNGDTLFSLNVYGADGTAAVQAAQITAQVDGTPGTNDMPGRLVFSTTADGASAPTERMRIDSAGNVGIGNATINNIKLRLGGDITGSTTAYGVYTGMEVQPDVTGRAIMYGSAPTTAVGATPTAITHFYATQSTLSGTPTAQYGFEATSALIGATNNYGFHSNIAAGTGRWNFFANGTAANYFAGNVQFAAGSAASPALTNISDTNTGIFFPAADTIAFAEGGVETMRLDSAGNLKFNSGYGSVATAYGCRAWVNFNGTGTVAIRASGNVSSITDNGVGDYTVNFATAMVDANYMAQGLAGFASTVGPMYVQAPSQSTDFTQTTTAFRFGTASAHSNGIVSIYRDTANIFLSIFR